ncbi:hypothetical protein [Anaerovibrio sp.]|uniref:hypothetical protein n=1 Tax=Anaerovibrio sp. TaxID=1872532 RepID=UPI003F141003
MENKFFNLITAIAKKLGVMDDDEKENTCKAQSFSEIQSQAQKEKIAAEIWDVTDALRRSLISAIDDSSLEDRKGTLIKNLSEFNTFAMSAAEKWSDGAIAVSKGVNVCVPSELELIVASKRLQFVEEPDIQEEPVQKNEMEENEMKIDKSKMTPGELAFFEEIEKRYSVNDSGTATEEPVVAGAEPVIEPEPMVTTMKSAAEAVPVIAPELKELLENVQKRLEQQEDAEMTAIAKKYELLGKKPEELAPVLKRLKKSSTEAYDGVIAMLDQSLDIAKRSGLFKEVGSSASAGANDVSSQISKRASEIRKSNPGLSRAEAIDRVFQENPELISEFDK